MTYRLLILIDSSDAADCTFYFHNQDGIHEFLLKGLSDSGIKIKHIEIKGVVKSWCDKNLMVVFYELPKHLEFVIRYVPN